MSLIDELREKIKGTEKQPTLASIIRKATGCPLAHIFISDRHLDLCTDEEVQEFLAKDLTEKEEYIAELFDCEQFSFMLFCSAKKYFARKRKNVAFGVIWTANHALCLFVNQEMKVKYIEPQNDQIVSIHSKPRLVIL